MKLINGRLQPNRKTMVLLFKAYSFILLFIFMSTVTADSEFSCVLPEGTTTTVDASCEGTVYLSVGGYAGQALIYKNAQTLIEKQQQLISESFNYSGFTLGSFSSESVEVDDFSEVGTIKHFEVFEADVFNSAGDAVGYQRYTAKTIQCLTGYQVVLAEAVGYIGDAVLHPEGCGLSSSGFTLGIPDNPTGCGEANPCNPATGAKFQTETDISLNKQGLEFTRYYNSQGQYRDSKSMGPNWRHNYNGRLVAPPESSQ